MPCSYFLHTWTCPFSSSSALFFFSHIILICLYEQQSALLAEAAMWICGPGEKCELNAAQAVYHADGGAIISIQ